MFERNVKLTKQNVKVSLLILIFFIALSNIITFFFLSEFSITNWFYLYTEVILFTVKLLVSIMILISFLESVKDMVIILLSTKLNIFELGNKSQYKNLFKIFVSVITGPLLIYIVFNTDIPLYKNVAQDNVVQSLSMIFGIIITVILYLYTKKEISKLSKD